MIRPLTKEERKLRKKYLADMAEAFHKALPYMDGDDFNEIVEELEDDFANEKGYYPNECN